jgi:hypothetical protein
MNASAVMVSILLALAVFSVWRLPPLHPAQLWSIPWALAAGLYFMHLLPYRRLSVETVVLVCGSCLAFVVGTLIGERIVGRRAAVRDWRSNANDVAIRWAAAAAVGLTALMLCAFLAQAAEHFGVRATLVSTAKVRNAIGAGGFSLTIKYVYAAIAASALCAIAAARDSGTHSIRWHAATLLSILSVYFSTGRSTLVETLLVALVAYLLARERPLSRLRFVSGSVAVGVLALVIFIVGGNVIGKTFANNLQLQALPSTFTQHPRLRVLALPYEYASAPIAALEVQVDAATPFGTTHGCAAFSEACRVLNRLGLPLQGASRIRPFTNAPLPWNTYTALDLPLLDGGVVFVVPILALIGILLGSLWQFAQRDFLTATCAYAILAPAAVASSGSFNFTAPYLVGAVIIALTGFFLAPPLRRVFGRPTAALEQP